MRRGSSYPKFATGSCSVDSPSLTSASAGQELLPHQLADEVLDRIRQAQGSFPTGGTPRGQIRQQTRPVTVPLDQLVDLVTREPQR
jgi:hypothetical protein